MLSRPSVLSKLLLTPGAYLGILCASMVGCHRRGYTDLYVDAMASDIRDLQDQLYEYDHEYRLLEQELESLRRQNASQSEIHRTTPQAEPVPSSPLQFQPRDELPRPERGSVSPQQNSLDNLPNRNPREQSTLPSIITEPEGLRTAPAPAPEEIQPAPSNLPAFPSGGSGGGSDSPTDFDFDPDEISIPSITTSSVQPPKVSPRKLDASPESDLEIGLSQIELPLQLTSTADANRGAKINEATEVIADRRVVELAFHPILCRSVNFDDDDQEDGVFLVLQPRNQGGQFVPVPALLTVEIIDQSRETTKSQIGFWEYSIAEVKDKIQPIGSQQGIHLTLPWNGPNPKADRITVRATYIFENGRQIASQKELFISGPGKLKTVWTPRVGRSQTTIQPSPQLGHHSPDSDRPPAAVVPASGESVLGQSRHSAIASGSFLPPDSAPSPERQ